MDTIKENDDMNNWANEVKLLIDLYGLPEDIKFRWYWYYAEGFTPKQAIRDYDIYLKENNLK